MKLKKVLAGVLAASSALALAGCGDSGNGSTPAGNSGSTSNTSSGTNSGAANSGGGTSAPEEVKAPFSGFDASIKGLKVDESKIVEGTEIEVWSNRTDRDSTSNGGNGYLEEMVKEFEDYYKVKVKWRTFKDYDTEVKQNLNANLKNSGDVVCFPSGISPKKYGDYFEPLGTVGEMSDYIDITNKAVGDGDEAVVYGIPNGCNGTGICYNTKVWADAGITETPKTVDEFIADLKLIKEKTDALPIMCCYNDAGKWNLKEYTQYAGAASGDPNFKTKLLVNGGDIFVEGEPYYEMCRMMFEVYSNPDLHEKDVSTSQWEASKMLLAQGRVATFVIGSWGVAQFKEAGLAAGVSEEEAANVSLMPVPYNVDGKQYSLSGSDRAYCINKESSEAEKETGKAFIKWWVENSSYAKDEGYIPVLKTATIDDYPDCFKAWSDVVFFQTEPTPGAISSTWGEIDITKSRVGLEEESDDDNHFKRKICMAAMQGKSMDEFHAILAEQNKNWATAREADEELQAFINSPDAEKYKDERFAKKAGF